MSLTVRERVVLLVAVFVTTAADAPPVGAPTWDQLANLGPSGILAAGIGLLITGRLVPGNLLTRAEARTDAAIAAAAATAKTQEASNQAIAALTKEHEEERREWSAKLDLLTKQLAALGGAK